MEKTPWFIARGFVNQDGCIINTEDYSAGASYLTRTAEKLETAEDVCGRCATSYRKELWRFTWTYESSCESSCECPCESPCESPCVYSVMHSAPALWVGRCVSHRNPYRCPRELFGLTGWYSRNGIVYRNKVVSETFLIGCTTDAEGDIRRVELKVETKNVSVGVMLSNAKYKCWPVMSSLEGMFKSIAKTARRVEQLT
jgi:hypothetical protein